MGLHDLSCIFIIQQLREICACKSQRFQKVAVMALRINSFWPPGMYGCSEKFIISTRWVVPAGITE